MKLRVAIAALAAILANEQSPMRLEAAVADVRRKSAALGAAVKKGDVDPDDDDAPLAKKPAPVARVEAVAPRESEQERLDRLDRFSGLVKPKPKKPAIAARPVHVIEPVEARSRMLAADADRLVVPLAERLGFARMTHAKFTQADKWTAKCLDKECGAMSDPDEEKCRLCGGPLEATDDLAAFATGVARLAVRR